MPSMICTASMKSQRSTSSSSSTSEVRPPRRRQCWECLRRRLVCDFGTPTCNKCRAAGVTCPGYGEKKPLKWIAPGRVNSRTRQRRRPPASESEERGQIASPNHAALVAKDPDPPSGSCSSERAVVKLTIPRLQLGTEANAVVQAASYYNACIYPSFAAFHQLAPNPYITRFSHAVIPHLPPAMCHLLVCLALGHRIQSLMLNTDYGALIEVRSRLYHHRGMAIQLLADAIGNAITRTSDLTIASVLMLLFTDARQSLSSNWRHHCVGANELIMLRGGLPELYRSSPALKQSLLYFIIIGVIGNTTTPPADQIAAASHVHLIDFVAEIYGDGLFPVLPCPPSLFRNIIEINHLRSLAMDPACVREPLQSAAQALLDRISVFSPHQWSTANATATCHDEWLLLGRIYHSAVSLFGIAALQSAGLLPAAPLLEATRAAHARVLFLLLRRAMRSHPIQKGMVWPLIVAGVEAANAGPADRAFVDEQLTEMSRDLGTPVPLQAKPLFQRFWGSENVEWDDCFDRSHVFVV
ncbi:Zn(II)2Cys6 transcription factor [Aspergillus candidus]|uniref:Fungal-specific transcription factor domain-domain-containing protein n=1 Tax=Aspergillus candidus TaxID=41067 RepID=A0A2I2FBN1_ASPCN|nr:fungal-specific transcription factor domain-domain-containing protein [Aspergillus candidus]PLB38034.1 fungal-specific transcription factor domain-domain-containing protein [Aspergillus candidus]